MDQKTSDRKKACGVFPKKSRLFAALAVTLGAFLVFLLSLAQANGAAYYVVWFAVPALDALTFSFVFSFLFADGCPSESRRGALFALLFYLPLFLAEGAGYTLVNTEGGYDVFTALLSGCLSSGANYLVRSAITLLLLFGAFALASALSKKDLSKRGDDVRFCNFSSLYEIALFCGLCGFFLYSFVSDLASGISFLVANAATYTPGEVLLIAGDLLADLCLFLAGLAFGTHIVARAVKLSETGAAV